MNSGPHTSLLKRYAIGSGVPDKTKIATHFEMGAGPVQYYVLTEEAEEAFIQYLGRANDAGGNLYFHEQFSDKRCLVFDVDNEDYMEMDVVRDLLPPIYQVLRSMFEFDDINKLLCTVFDASSPAKKSYHISFPEIVVDKIIMKRVYEQLFKKDEKLRFVVDEQICSTQKLRLPFCDKYDKDRGQPVGRSLKYFGSFNYRMKRCHPDFASNSTDLVRKSKVRRTSQTPTTELKKGFSELPKGTPDDLSAYDFSTYDSNDFADMPPEFYSLQKCSLVIQYITEVHGHCFEDMCNRIVTYMNHMCWMISDHPGKIIYVVKKFNNELYKQPFTYVQKGQRDFVQYFQHIHVPIKRIQAAGDGHTVKNKNIAEIWCNHKDKKCYSQLCFNPNENHDCSNNFNTYQGMYFSTRHCLDYVETSGVDYISKARPILNHIKEVWCAGRPREYEYVIKWLAHAILRPWVKMGVALVLVGSEGCGKSILVDAIGRIYGCHYNHITDMEDILGRFTGALSNSLLVFADEAFWAGCKSLSGKLKGMITEEKIRCEYKGFDSYYLDNFSNFIFASNNHMAVPAGENARRWVCLECNNMYAQKSGYFGDLHEAIYGNGHCGLMCLVAYLALDVDLSSFVPSQFPKTALLRAQKENSYDSLESWWHHVLHRGYVVPWEEYSSEYEMRYGPVANSDSAPFDKFVTRPTVQKLPLHKMFDLYTEEQKKVGIGKVFPFQRFRQFLMCKNAFDKIKAPKGQGSYTYIRIDFQKCRDEWRKNHDDPDMIFEGETNEEIS